VLTPVPTDVTGPIFVPVTHNTGSKAAIDLINHALRGRIPKGSRPPTRLLDVRNVETGQVWLRHDNQVDRNTCKYIALSHCWGKLKILKLLHENMEEFTERGIDIARLPRTFREAMLITHALGICYIWIDSLCIIQNSKDDWRQEAARMADVYRGAICTFAATGAWDGSEGLFRPQNPLQCSPCLIGTTRTMRNGTSTHLGVPIYAILCTQTEERMRLVDLTLSKWNRRAWCLQERKWTTRFKLRMTTPRMLTMI
jgi:hypothetical protein